MKSVLVSCALLAGLPLAAGAQDLVYGVTLGNVQAVRDVNQNLSAITGLLANQSDRAIDGVWLTFVLYDEQGREVGRLRNDVPGPLAPGQIKPIRAVTPRRFARVTALDVDAR